MVLQPISASYLCSLSQHSLSAPAPLHIASLYLLSSLPMVTYSDSKVTYSDSKVTYSDLHRVTHTDPPHLPLPPPTPPDQDLANSNVN